MRGEGLLRTLKVVLDACILKLATFPAADNPAALIGSMIATSRHSAIRNPQSAILLLGPTGSGKTPVGQCLERGGLLGRRCAHFDFGANLREAVATGGESHGLDADEVAFLERVLHANVLLEDEHFPIARHILEGFCRRRGVGRDDCLILNGLPRHVGQADDVDALVDVRAVLHLECPAKIVRERIHRDSGGDRGKREDDSAREVERKLRTFSKRTMPLLDHYRDKGVLLCAFAVAVDTAPDDVVAEFERQMRAGKPG
jgi:adenylate kinase